MIYKLAFICGNGHVSVIQKADEVPGRIPEFIQCVKMNCGCEAGFYERHALLDSVVATHEFYKPVFGDILSIDENNYIDAGGLLFREIPENVPGEVVDELKSAKEILKLATFLVGEYPYLAGAGTPVDAAILLIENTRFPIEQGFSTEINFQQYIDDLKKAL